MIWGMTSDRLPEFREALTPFLEGFAARSHGQHTAEQLFADVEAAMRQVWVCGDFKAVALTRVEAESVHIGFCSGSDRFDWQEDLHQEIGAWAKNLGKKRMFVMCRPGWSRRAKEAGFKELHRELMREL